MMKIEAFYNIYLSSSGVSIDSRTIKPNQIFFAIRGENFDGHQFVGPLIQESSTYAVIEDPSFYVNEKTILVDDTLKFLQDLARYHRRQFDIPVFAITGSNGKTTTKELMTACLSKAYNLHATKGNYNNHLGVPLTLLGAKKDVDFMIIEMGANHVGEIGALCQIALPTHGLITNIGKAHIEGFGGVQGIIKGKTELYAFLRASGGTIFCNSDDDVLCNQLKEGDDVEYYSSENVKVLEEGLTISFLSQSGHRTDTHLYGKYNLTNVVAALAVSTHFNVDESMALEAIAEYSPEMNRSQVLQKGNTHFIMDAYNANPSSMKSSINALGRIENRHPKCLVLGDMKELGEDEFKYHKEIIDLISLQEWHFVALIGPVFKKAAGESPYAHYLDVNELVSSSGLAEKLNNTICLVKGSRSMQLEKLVELF